MAQGRRKVIEAMPGETRVGLIGEHIACAAILMLPGVKGATLAQQDKVDCVAWDEHGFIRIQVKSGKLRTEKGRAPTYHINYGSGLKKTMPSRDDYDILATVAIEKRRVLFTAMQDIKVVSKRISPKRFDDPDIEVQSWRRALAVLRGEA